MPAPIAGRTSTSTSVFRARSPKHAAPKAPEEEAELDPGMMAKMIQTMRQRIEELEKMLGDGEGSETGSKASSWVHARDSASPGRQ